MNERAKAAAWRTAKAILAGLISAILVGIVQDQAVFGDLLKGNYSPEFFKALQQIVVTAVVMGALKYYGVKLPAPPKL